MPGPVKAITFDLWDTIVHDESDEKKRAEKGLRTKRDERRHLLHQALQQERETPLHDVVIAYDVCDAAFRRAWREQHVTWTLPERVAIMLEGLGRTLSPAAMGDLCDGLGRMEVDVPPELIPGMDHALAELAGRYRLAIASDAIVTPGRRLRELLDVYDLRRHFTGFAFSDEVGRAKPDRRMFESAASQLGVRLEEMVHVGDRDHNDVKGPQALGMRAVLFTATRDADKDATSADAVCERAADLPAVIDALAGEAR